MRTMLSAANGPNRPFTPAASNGRSQHCLDIHAVANSTLSRGHEKRTAVIHDPSNLGQERKREEIATTKSATTDDALASFIRSALTARPGLLFSGSLQTHRQRGRLQPVRK